MSNVQSLKTSNLLQLMFLMASVRLPRSSFCKKGSDPCARRGKTRRGGKSRAGGTRNWQLCNLWNQWFIRLIVVPASWPKIPYCMLYREMGREKEGETEKVLSTIQSERWGRLDLLLCFLALAMWILERCHCSCRFTTATLTIWWHALKQCCKLRLQNLKAVASKCCHNLSQPVSVPLFIHDSMMVNALQCFRALLQSDSLPKHGLKMTKNTKEHKYNGRMVKHLRWRHKECLLSPNLQVSYSTCGPAAHKSLCMPAEWRHHSCLTFSFTTCSWSSFGAKDLQLYLCQRVPIVGQAWQIDVDGV